MSMKRPRRGSATGPIPHLEKLAIRLDGEDNVMYAGQLVSGVVKLRFSQSEPLESVIVQVSGAARVYWKETRRCSVTGENRHFDFYRSGEDLLNQELLLWGQAPDENQNRNPETTPRHPEATHRQTDGTARHPESTPRQKETSPKQTDGTPRHCEINPRQSEGTLQPSGTTTTLYPGGSSQIPFQFQVPSTCPTSFESDCGHIRYFVRAFVRRSGGAYVSCKQPFTVLQPRPPPSVENDKLAVASVECDATLRTQGCWCFSCFGGAPLSAVLRLPKRCYAAGETILVDVDVCNKSRRLMTQTTMKLVQLTSFKGVRTGFGTSRTNTVRRTVVKAANFEPIPPGTSKKWRQQEFRVPCLAPTIDMSSGLISVCYELLLRVEADDTFSDLELVTPLHIQMLPKKVSRKFSGMALVAYKCVQPPTNIREADDATNVTTGELEFAPEYPLYRMGSFRTKPIVRQVHFIDQPIELKISTIEPLVSPQPTEP